MKKFLQASAYLLGVVAIVETIMLLLWFIKFYDKTFLDEQISLFSGELL